MERIEIRKGGSERVITDSGVFSPTGEHLEPTSRELTEIAYIQNETYPDRNPIFARLRVINPQKARRVPFRKD